MSRTLCRGGLLALLTALPALAQFYQLATTHDGMQLYFLSQQVLKGKGPRGHETRLYRATSDGVSLFAERSNLVAEGSRFSGIGMWSPSVSGDGTLVAAVLQGICLDAECSSTADEAYVLGSRSLDLGTGTVKISRNGKWATLSSIERQDDPATPVITTKTLIDLTTGARQKILSVADNGANYYLENSLASDGTVFVFVPDPSRPFTAAGSFSLWKQGKVAPVVLPFEFDGWNFVLTDAALSDDASTLIGIIAAPSLNPSPSGIVAIDLRTGKLRTILPISDRNPCLSLGGVSNNGQRVLYRVCGADGSDGLALVWDSAADTTIPVPLAEGELAIDGTLSGSGEIAFVSTDRLRILKFTIATGRTALVFPEQPRCDEPGDLGRGSLARLHCTFSGTVAELSHHLFFNGVEVPVLYTNGRDIGVQIDWHADFMWNDRLSNDLPSESPFQAEQPVGVFDGAPAILPSDPSTGSLFGIQIVKGDFSGYVTRSPLPGDIVHIYMVGLGPVDGTPVIGVPAADVSRMQWQLSCRFQPGGSMVTPLYAGLAPGMLGVYQTTFIVPPGSGPVTTTELTCDVTIPNGRTRTIGPGTPAAGMCGGGDCPIGFPAI